jgi:hypothetical protein
MAPKDFFHSKTGIWLKFETFIHRDDNKKRCKNGEKRAKHIRAALNKFFLLIKWTSIIK